MSYPFNMQHHTPVSAVVAIALACIWISCGPSGNAKRPDANKNDAKIATQAKDGSAKRYSLTGRVVSIDKANNSLLVDGDDIPGFMPAMTMPYSVKDASILDKVSPGDRIKAEIVVADDSAYLENVVVTQKAPSPKSTK